MKIAIGHHILCALGALTVIETTRDTALMFEQKTRLNNHLREIKAYNFDSLNFVEQTIWKPKYIELLRRVNHER